MSLPKPVKVGSEYNGITIAREIESHTQSNGRKRRKVEVICHCGTLFDTMLENLYAGYTKSCGCNHIEHGMSKTKFKFVHTNMKARCDNPQHPQYKDYGGRGITYDPRWSSFKKFIEDMYEGYEEGLTLDRKDVDGDYSKDNCRWAGMSIQGHNKRKKEDCLFEYKGIRYNLNKTRYVAAIKNHYISTFDRIEDAAKAYDNASEILFNDRPNQTLNDDPEIFEMVRKKLISIELTKETK
jgi:hypothetical protein